MSPHLCRAAERARFGQRRGQSGAIVRRPEYGPLESPSTQAPSRKRRGRRTGETLRSATRRLTAPRNELGQAGTGWDQAGPQRAPLYRVSIRLTTRRSYHFRRHSDSEESVRRRNVKHQWDRNVSHQLDFHTRADPGCDNSSLLNQAAGPSAAASPPPRPRWPPTQSQPPFFGGPLRLVPNPLSLWRETICRLLDSQGANVPS
jgi:hypothetical protein